MLGRVGTLGGLIALIDAPPTVVNLVLDMVSSHMTLRSGYTIILTFWAKLRLPGDNYFVIGVYYQLLLRGGIVFASV